MSSWFDIDKQGLAAVMGRKDDKSFILAELVQNAWDAPDVTSVEVDLEPIPGVAKARLTVTDDSPVGFTDLSHAFTLFAPSGKKSDPTRRGRFNFGEKLVLSLCEEASVETTTGTIRFDDNGRSRSRSRRDRGTKFSAIIRITRSEVETALAHLRTFIAPADITTRIGGIELERRQPIASFEVSLPTEIANDEGILRRTTRKTRVSVYRPIEGAKARVYEMGIPVAETADSFDVDVAQKIPLSLERDNVSRSWLEKLRVAVASQTFDLLDKDDVTASWIGEALGSPDLSSDAAAAIVRKRFGERVVAYDPSDREANDLATSRGYTVLMGGTLSKEQWNTVRRAGSVLPAGRVTPSPKPFSENGPEAEDAARTEAIEIFDSFTRALALRLMGVEIEVRFLKTFNAAAAYGSRRIFFNVQGLGRKWFEGPLRREHLDLLIHEFGHEYEANHLSSRYLDALTRLGGECAMAALENPPLFDLESHRAVLASPAPAGMISRTELVGYLRSAPARNRMLMALKEGSAPAHAVSSELSRRFGIHHGFAQKTLEMVAGLIDVAASAEGYEKDKVVQSATDPIFRTANTFRPIPPLFPEG